MRVNEKNGTMGAGGSTLCERERCRLSRCRFHAFGDVGACFGSG